ncbi:MAG: BamA/TamA family outer membrane protein [Deltaproteobacteria bacterium]|nr:BamA/TamA family outer membrane protein [Deltaproteobacteria bacterium]
MRFRLAPVLLSTALCLGPGLPLVARADDAPTPVQPLGVRYRIERVEVTGNRHTRRDVILSRVPFRTGRVLDVDDPRIEETRLRLLATGYFSEVELSLRRGQRRGWVVLEVRVRERGTLLVHDLALGVAQGDFYGGLDAGDVNFLGLGIDASAAFVAGRGQQAYRLRLLHPTFFGPRSYFRAMGLYSRAADFVATGDVRSSECSAADDYRCDRARVRYERGGMSFGGGHTVTGSLRLNLRWRLEVVRALELPLAASEPRGDEVVAVDPGIHPGMSRLSTLAAGVEYDSRDDPYMPSTGVRAWGEAELSAWVTGSSYEYARFTSGIEAYARLGWGHVLKLDVFGGLIVGDAPVFEQFFVGDLSDLVPSRILDIAFDERSAPNLLGTTVAEMRYEDIAGRVGLEYAVPLHRSRSIVYGVDFFAGVGLYALASMDDLVLPPSGYDGPAKLPIDVTFDLGFRVDTEIGVFGLSFSNLIGLVPFRQEEP